MFRSGRLVRGHEDQLRNNANPSLNAKHFPEQRRLNHCMTCRIRPREETGERPHFQIADVNRLPRFSRQPSANGQMVVHNWKKGTVERAPDSERPKQYPSRRLYVDVHAADGFVEVVDADNVQTGPFLCTRRGVPNLAEHPKNTIELLTRD